MRRRPRPFTLAATPPGPAARPLSKDISTLTDLNSEDLPEVEIISLIGENIPTYKLKADYLTEFAGVQNRDFTINTPLLSSETEAEIKNGLTPEQAEATLDYLLSCGSRLSQMTKTFHDYEALSRLLQEKEKDLELAAKIGQELLERNKFLDEKIVQLETVNGSSTDLITQLKHDLTIKTDLLHFYTDSDDNNQEDPSTPAELRNINFDLLQKKVKTLEDENKKLHEEARSVRIFTYFFYHFIF